MRIIAGEFRGRTLLPPEGQNTRPITDRAKQSVFDILQPYLEGANVYDCFAGTGSMGLECLSRGSRFATFFESDPSAVRLLKKNIEVLKLENRCRIVSSDIFKWAASPHPNPPPEYDSTELAAVRERGQEALKAVDILFFDPPYRFLIERPTELKSLMTQLHPHLSPEAICIFRHDAADSLEFPEFLQFDCRDYGQMRVEFLRPFHRPAGRDTILP